LKLMHVSNGPPKSSGKVAEAGRAHEKKILPLLELALPIITAIKQETDQVHQSEKMKARTTPRQNCNKERYIHPMGEKMNPGAMVQLRCNWQKNGIR